MIPRISLFLYFLTFFGAHINRGSVVSKDVKIVTWAQHGLPSQERADSASSRNLASKKISLRLAVCSSAPLHRLLLCTPFIRTLYCYIKLSCTVGIKSCRRHISHARWRFLSRVKHNDLPYLLSNSHLICRNTRIDIKASIL